MDLDSKLSYQIGDIVSLNSHPFFDDLTSTLIGGEPQLIPPLMIVVEILKEAKKFDEKTGEEIYAKGDCQCKCIWYSSKSSKYEETWLFSKQIKLIVKYTQENESSILRDTMVVLSTSHLESTKIKFSIKHEDDFDSIIGNNKTSTSPLLSFVSPVMQVIQIKEVTKSDIKEPLYDIKTGNQKRFYSKKTVKCKWFNPIGDKLSEVWIPLEALKPIDRTPIELLHRIKNSINNDDYLKILYSHDRADLQKIKQSIIKPLAIIYINGYYKLKAYDYILNKIIKEAIVEGNIEEVANPFKDKVPNFNYTSGQQMPSESLITSEKLEELKNAIDEKLFVRIKYLNRNHKTSIRTLKDLSLIHLKDSDNETTWYLQGYCFLRKEVRTFRIERIQTLQVLNLNWNS